MKKQLLTGAFLLASFLTANAQLLQLDDFTSYTVGNLGTSIAGDVAGQNGWFTYTVANGGNEAFQIVNSGGANGNALQIVGASVPAGTTNATNNARYAWKGTFGDAWTSRTEGNDYLNFITDFKAVSPTGSTSVTSMIVYDPTGTPIGGLQYRSETGYLRGLIYVNTGTAATTGLYYVPLGEENEDATEVEDLVITDAQWYKLGLSIDTTTGTLLYLVDGQVANGSLSESVIGLTPDELDFQVSAGTANTASTTATFDNIRVKADATDADILSTPAVIAASKFSVFPNPSNGVVTVANANALINAISVTDINGRTVKNVKVGGVASTEVNISDLASGVYMMSISSDKGTSTQKIVKN